MRNKTKTIQDEKWIQQILAQAKYSQRQDDLKEELEFLKSLDLRIPKTNEQMFILQNIRSERIVKIKKELENE